MLILIFLLTLGLPTFAQNDQPVQPVQTIRFATGATSAQLT